MSGFSVYSSIHQVSKTEKIPYPAKGEKLLGGHAVMAVAYDDRMKIPNANPNVPRILEAHQRSREYRKNWARLIHKIGACPRLDRRSLIP